MGTRPTRRRCSSTCARPEQNLRIQRWRYAAGPGEDHRPADRRHRNGRDLHERRLGGDVSLNAAIRADDDSGEWQDWLVDESRTRRRRSPRARSSITAARPVRCAHRAQQARAAHLRNASARRGTDHARGAGRGIRVSRERVRQIEVSAFEKVQNAVKHRAARWDPGASAGALASTSPVVGETDDGRVAMAVLRQPSDARGRRSPVLIKSSLDDPCTALYIIDRRLSARCRWKAIRRFIMKSGCRSCALAAASSRALG